MSQGYEINDTKVRLLLETVDAGLTKGLGKPIPGQMCVEAAVCYSMGLPHSDKPLCVSPIVQVFKIGLNDAPWSSNKARAWGMREIAVAQLGSENIDSVKFVSYVSEQIIRRVLPIVLRKINLEKEALHCEQEGTAAAARAAYAAAATDAAAYATDAAAYATDAAARAAAYARAADARAAAAARAAYAAAAARAAAYAADAAARAAAYARAADADAAARAADADAAARAAAYAAVDSILILVATIGVEALKLCGAEGVKYLHLCKDKKEG